MHGVTQVPEVDVLPARKRNPESSDSGVVYTGEIEVLEEDRGAARPARPPARAERPDSRTRLACPKPPSRPPSRLVYIDPSILEPEPPPPPPRQTIVPPPRPSYPELAELSRSDDEMTRLIAYRPRSSAPPSWRPVPSPQPARSSLPTPEPFEPEDRTVALPQKPRPDAARVPAAMRIGPVERAPDSLRPVAMAALVGEQSGRHEALPTSITMRAQMKPGRPTAVWAAALVVLGVAAGLASSFFARGDGAPVAKSSPVVRTHFIEGTAPASAERSQGSAATAAGAQAPPAIATIAEASARQLVPTAPPATVAQPPTDPVAALVDKAASPSPTATSRPVYEAPTSSYTPPPRRWTASARPIVHAALAAPAVPAAAAAPLAVLDQVPPAAPAPAASKSTRSRGKRASDADLQAASASEALARAQLEAALR